MMPRQDDPQLKLRLPQSLKTTIEVAAAHNNRSTNAEIVARLEASGEALRDKFAGQAMAAIIIGNGADVSAMSLGAARDAYAVADAMLEARK